MNSSRWLQCRALPGLLALLVLGPTWAFAGMNPGAYVRPLDYDTSTRIDVNNIDMFVTNEGSFAYNQGNGDAGLLFPKGTTKTAVFAAGLWIGAKVNGENRVSVAEYSDNYVPGQITGPGQWGDPVDSKYQVYRISTGDNASNNPDYANWPILDGAPKDSTGNPLLLGDQTLWAVYNDSSPLRLSNNAGSASGLGLEIQQTTFGFNRTGALGNVIFLNFKIINKGGNTLEDAYISVWSDPDNGQSSDDLVGCDTTLSLGYCYNATNSDNIYGSNPPAIGFDFFQGPIVPSEGDTALVSGRKVPGYRNLPMTSFNKYINGTDPDSPLATYNYQQGLGPDGTDIEDPNTGQATKFMVAGDPVTNTGWLDSNPADRRMMLSSGPFTMAPGDTQEVVAALIVGQGKDRLTSITALKFFDKFAQTAFDVNFDLPSPPPRPQATAAALDKEVVLYWGDVSETQYNEPGYAFEGYNVYMGESVAGPWTRIATYDLNNNVAFIFDDQFDLDTGVVINKPVQFGTDSGLRHSLSITNDAINGGGLNNATPYYFAITSYSYGPEKGAGLKTLENSIESIMVTPQGPTAGTELGGAFGDTLAVTRTGGTSDGRVVALVVDPTQTTGDTYEITFDSDSTGAFWNLRTTTGRSVLTNQRNQTGDENYLVADGILWKVIGALPGFKINGKGNPMIDEIKTAGGADVAPDVNGGPGNDVWHSNNSTVEWRLSAGGGDGGVGRLTRDGGDNVNLTSSDIIMKWDNDPKNIGFWAFDDGEVGLLPFGLYLRDPVTGTETRLIAALTGGGYTAGVYDFPDSEQVVDPSSGLPATDWTYAYTYSGSYDDFVADAADGTIDNDPRENELFARLIVASGDKVMPAAGTVIQFSTTKPNTPVDKFQVSTKDVKFVAQEAKDNLKQILVVPNPYFAHSRYEQNQFQRVVKFTNLPPECTIRVFNIAGELVRTLEKTRSSVSSLEWDLLTDRHLPLASGVYIYHVEAKDGNRTIGSTFGRMAVFMEKERLNTF